MPSIKDGDYRVIGAVRSASDINAWYPVAHDLKTPQYPSGNPKLSCHCPAWTKNVAGGEERVCKHTKPFHALLRQQQPTGLRRTTPTLGGDDIGEVLGYNPALAHITGNWAAQEFEAPIIGTKAGHPVEEPYHWWMLRVQTAEQISAAGVVAVPAGEVPQDRRILKQTLAAWAGYQIAAEFLIRAGLRPGEPPAHFREDARKIGKRAREIAPHLRQGEAPKPPRPDGAPKYGIGDLMIAMNDTDQGDGLVPAQRAEDLLRVLLGGSYANVDPKAAQYRGYLDVPSRAPQAELDFLWQLDNHPQTGSRRLGGLGVPRQCRSLIYRVRVDKDRKYDRRVRVWIDGNYRIDLCIVREGYTNSKVPVADGFISRYMGFLANPITMLKVMGGYNIFGPRSDTYYGDDRYGEEPPAPLRAA